MEEHMTTTSPVQIGQHKNKDGETFGLSWWKWEEPVEADYRMYFIKAHHKDWGDKIYTAFITKNSYPKEEDATHLATSYLLQEIKKRLDKAKEGKHIILFSPMNHEGWALI